MADESREVIKNPISRAPEVGGNMLRGLGAQEAESILAERSEIEVGCEFCGQQYRFDAVDAAQLFLQSAAAQPPAPSGVQ